MIPTATRFYALDSKDVTSELDDAFFSALKFSSGIFKRTYSGRFAELDRELVSILKSEGARLREVLDVGASSGITTLEFATALRAIDPDIKVTGTDVVLEAFIVDVLPCCRALVDGEGFVLQHDVFGLAVRPWRRRLDYVSGMIALRPLINRVLAPRARTAMEAGRNVRPVTLVSRRIEQDENVRVIRDDLREKRGEFQGCFDFIRVGNVLNVDYFDEPDRRIIAANVASYLDPAGSWLLVLRSDTQERHNGTLFRYSQAEGFRVQERFGKGSEVEGLILESRVAAPMVAKSA